MRFSDLRVLDFCWVGAGAFVTRLLADLGAEVIKVESRAHPDNLRLSGPHKPGARHLEGSGYFASRNTNKKSIALNMGRPEARALAKELARKCSVVTNNFRPGVMERWGLGYAELAAADPALDLSRHADAGQLRAAQELYRVRLDHRGASPGWSRCRARRSARRSAPARIIPITSPIRATRWSRLLAAIFHRARTGEGQYIELAQLESTVNLLGPSILRYSATGALPHRTGNRREGSAPCGVFPCAGDDVWCAIEVENDAGWQALVEALGRPQWMTDARFETLMGRSQSIDTIEAKLAQETRKHDAAELVSRLQARGVASSLVETSRDVMEDAQLNARGYWRAIDHAEMGRITVNVPPFFSAEEGRKREPAPPPLLGEQTREIATSLLGLSESECTRLMNEEVLW